MIKISKLEKRGDGMKLENTNSVFNLGDTSFRRKTLLDDYKVILPILKITWKRLIDGGK